MADVETKETKVVASPEKKVVEKEIVEEKKVVEKEIEEVDEDSRASENGDSKEAKENGEEKVAEEKEAESTENGDSTDAPVADACCIKRKSTAGVEASVDAVDGISPEKKAKLEDKPVVEAESNGDTTETAA